MKINIKYVIIICLIFTASILLSGCIPGDGTNTSNNPAGFFWGVWHGWLAPISLVASLFNHKLRVYEVLNTGWWYDFGFYIAIIGGFGGLSLTRDKKRSKNQKE